MTYEEKRTLWFERVEAYRCSKQPITIWCDQNKVSVHTLRTWITKYNKENKAPCTDNEWLSVEIPGPTSKTDTRSKTSGIVINIGSAYIEISSEFNPTTLEAVIAILSRRC